MDHSSRVKGGTEAEAMMADQETRRAVLTGSAASLFIISFQMAGKATRDAIFLSTFTFESLPAMVMVASAVSLIAALLVGRVASRLDPARVVPTVFVVSAALTVVEWLLIDTARRFVAVALFLHFSGLGALLVSGFWSVVSERFDPRTAKRHLSRIAMGGTIGGLAGGVLAERTGSLLSVEAMLPMLAVMHMVAGGLTFLLGRSSPRKSSVTRDNTKSGGAGLQVLWRSPYFVSVSGFLLFAAISEGTLDLAFKGRVVESFGDGEALLRFFAIFYTVSGVLTIALQGGASDRVIRRLGIAGSIGVLPSVVAFGVGATLVAPSLAAIVIARGSEALVRNSVFRSGYELLFSSVGTEEKRAVKPLLDVGVARVGDVIAAMIVQVLFFAVVRSSLRTTAALWFSIVFAVAAVAAARRLHREYLKSLEESLVKRGGYLDADSGDPAQTGILETMWAADVTQLMRAPPPAAGESTHAVADEMPLVTDQTAGHAVARITELTSGSRERVRAAIRAPDLAPAVVPFVIPLLAQDDLARDVIHALRPGAARTTGILVDFLLDETCPVEVRRRLPLVLAGCVSPRAVEGLIHGLDDTRFEVRYRCGRALKRLRTLDDTLTIDSVQILSVVAREVRTEKEVWRGRQVLDAVEEGWSSDLDTVVRDRADRSLEHVFNVLSLILPAQPLTIAFRGLQTDDPFLRGTALEYLESVLPEDIKEGLWPFLEESEAPKSGPSKSAGQVLDDLLRSKETIAIRLDELRQLDKPDHE